MGLFQRRLLLLVLHALMKLVIAFRQSTNVVRNVEINDEFRLCVRVLSVWVVYVTQLKHITRATHLWHTHAQQSRLNDWRAWVAKSKLSRTSSNLGNAARPFARGMALHAARSHVHAPAWWSRVEALVSRRHQLSLLRCSFVVWEEIAREKSRAVCAAMLQKLKQAVPSFQIATASETDDVPSVGACSVQIEHHIENGVALRYSVLRAESNAAQARNKRVAAENRAAEIRKRCADERERYICTIEALDRQIAASDRVDRCS